MFPRHNPSEKQSRFTIKKARDFRGLQYYSAIVNIFSLLEKDDFCVVAEPRETK